ncbi:hypothetical protein D9615_009855 [Tricholomella constricta]|uniref:BTB domain-containing protein n=1 Tax=Tricholomella constricta TaxID=117010 RepID=A0A8H5LX21_9AGAR|nr:hypothetical protein D9615_009855 [Tricholomella constricta]
MSDPSSEAEDRNEVSSVRPCPDCSLPVDVILESKDGVRFAAHSKNLENYSEGFPPAIFVSSSEVTPIVQIEEHSETVQLLLGFMHLKRQPQVAKLSFAVLDALANAAEKYFIHSAIQLCQVFMAKNVEQHPIEVLHYAAKHSYKSLANRVAFLTLDYTFEDMKAKFEPDSRIPYLWLAYKERWMVALRSLLTSQPPAGNLHKGGVQSCDLWWPFYVAVLHDVGSSLVHLRDFETTVSRNLAEIEACWQCSQRAIRWGNTTAAKCEGTWYSALENHSELITRHHDSASFESTLTPSIIMADSSSDAENEVSSIRPCPDCNLPVDIILKSGDGIKFSAHSKNLENYSEGFPPAIFTSSSGVTPIVQIEEQSDIVELLLGFMHLKPQPEISNLPITVLEALANAAEKYFIHSAIPICKVYMTKESLEYPIEVLRYAAKHNYKSLADEAAPHTLDYTFEDVKPKFEPESRIPYLWVLRLSEVNLIMKIVGV